MNQEWRDFHEAKGFLDRIFNSPLSGRRWPGYLSVEQIMIRLGLHHHSVYKLMHKHLVPRGGVYRRGWGRHGRAGRLLVTQETFEDYVKDRERRRRRNKLVISTRWTRSGPRPVPPKRAPRPREGQTLPRLLGVTPSGGVSWPRPLDPALVAFLGAVDTADRTR